MKDMARYYWSADGADELVEEREITIDEPCVCYHCERKIYAGEKAAELTSAINGYIYVLHKKCAERSVRN